MLNKSSVWNPKAMAIKDDMAAPSKQQMDMYGENRTRPKQSRTQDTGVVTLKMTPGDFITE